MKTKGNYELLKESGISRIGNYEREFDYYKIIFESKPVDYILNFLSDRPLLERAIAYLPRSQANARKMAARKTLERKRL